MTVKNGRNNQTFFPATKPIVVNKNNVKLFEKHKIYDKIKDKILIYIFE